MWLWPAVGSFTSLRRLSLHRLGWSDNQSLHRLTSVGLLQLLHNSLSLPEWNYAKVKASPVSPSLKKSRAMARCGSWQSLKRNLGAVKSISQPRSEKSSAQQSLASQAMALHKERHG